MGQLTKRVAGKQVNDIEQRLRDAWLRGFRAGVGAVQHDDELMACSCSYTAGYQDGVACLRRATKRAAKYVEGVMQ